MAEDNIQTVKLQVEAGKANPGSVGAVLGQYGVQLMDFCKKFNDESSKFDVKPGAKLPVTLHVNKKDRSFTMKISQQPVAHMIKDIIGCKGSGEPNKNKVGKLAMKDIMAIIEKKREELTGVSDQALINTVAGTARSMGVEVEIGENKDGQ